ncbi:spermine/spermidine synthase [Metarhizium album ARSEF 1941]|uniref:Spermine/spermidine synthase n=1 Tax=Metarhizium album (strain ARSEF 1941) TaxID=1081103 RepID=A0A0B2X0A2_METAS|nr:spermine/spermidine synthase [Metarhizium album ARSEF 1941]KHN99112.1 spermine/spermidine synthase [Metarhizium album ARSEF 1941]
MASKPAPRAASTTRPGACSRGKPAGFTPERFERELQDLADRARSDTFSNRLLGQLNVYLRIVLPLALLGLYSNVSQLNLSPVYGSIPSSIWHAKLVMGGCFLGWAGNTFLRDSFSITPANALPLVAVCIPGLQHFLASFSQTLGPKWGPVLTESLTLLPLAVFTSASIADSWEGARLGMLPGFVADAGPGIGSWALFKLFENQIGLHLPRIIGRLLVFTRLGLELVLGFAYMVLAPSKYLIYAAFPCLHSLFLNPHLQSQAASQSLASSLMTDNWLLIERRESVTGYISVLQSIQQGFRVMRCDHSLLGGEWISHGGGLVSEPVYGVFAMLEAVRLVDSAPPVDDKDAQALVIGLGAGTTPSALVSHGINTTVVELDPVVYEFASKYFGLKENNPPILQDAVSYTAELAKTAPSTYDYIVHDVFTGGAEPIDLFTLEFFQGLHALLKPQGVTAINYAGDLTLPSSKVIYRTIKQVFPTCRIFREMPPDMEAVKTTGLDFTNMVIFCKKTDDSPLSFRRPTAKDFLQSPAREEFLPLPNEIPETDMLLGEDEGILTRNETSKLAKWHETSAIGHWSLMRLAIPAMVWERW